LPAYARSEDEYPRLDLSRDAPPGRAFVPTSQRARLQHHRLARDAPLHVRQHRLDSEVPELLYTLLDKQSLAERQIWRAKPAQRRLSSAARH
jgi:hypothetical protein